MSSIPNYVKELVTEIAESEQFTNYTIETLAGCNQEDGFVGALIKVIISGDRNSVAAKLHLLCKLIPENAARRKEFNADPLFEREIMVYNKILPAMTAFQREKGLSDAECFISYPKCYAAVANKEDDQYVIIMEDLRPQGFVMWSKRLPTPFDHATQIVTELAKFHAVSFAVKDQRPDIYAEFRKLPDLWRNMLKGGFMNLQKMAFKRAIAVLDDVEHVRIVQDFSENTLKYYEEFLDENLCEPFGVITHGDCWINNVLFRYDNETNKLNDIILLDWQLTRLCSPVTDLFDSLLTTCDKDFLDNHFERLIRLYHKTLSKSIQRLGSDAEKLCSFEDLQNQLKKGGKYALMISLLTLPLALPDANEIPDLDNTENGPQNDDDEILAPFSGATQAIYHRRVNDLMAGLIRLGYYEK